VALMFLLLYPIDYYIDAPGGLAEVSRTIEVNYNQDKEINGSFSTTYIMAINRPSFFQFIVAYFSKYTESGELTGSYLDYTNDEINEISYLDKATSIDAAIIVAYEAASAINPDIHIAYEIKTLVFGKSIYLSYYDSISFGDEFLSILGDEGHIVYPNNNQADPEYVLAADLNADGICSTSELIAYYCQDTDTYLYSFRNEKGETYTVELTKNPENGRFGITFKTYYLVNDEETTPAYTEMNSKIGGPSGGLLSTLHIYNMLAAEDITHGRKIAGTGTILYDGSVGYIGGVKQKVATAYLNHVDVFFMPHLADSAGDNYVAAVAVCEELGIENYEEWLIPVASLSDALAYLATLED
jgi:PDZ domain-containing protein